MKDFDEYLSNDLRAVDKRPRFESGARTGSNEYFLDIAFRCSKQGTCLRRCYGAVLVDDCKTIISTGYTGQVSGEEHCSELGYCWRIENEIPSGSNYEKCKSVHAEWNSLIQAGKKARGSILYVVGYDVEKEKEVAGIPCYICSKMLLNAGVEEMFTRTEKYIYNCMIQKVYIAKSREAFETPEAE
jgi:dCMP deaminase